MPIGGAVLGAIFVLTQLTGSDANEQVAHTVATTLALLLFGALGTTGVALAHWQPRLALLGSATTLLALLAGTATIVLTWSNEPSLFFLLFGGTSGKVAVITDLLALVSAAACLLLLTRRRGEETGALLARLIGIGSLATLAALAILQVLENDIEIGARVYGILAATFVFAFATVLALWLLPRAEDAPEPAS